MVKKAMVMKGVYTEVNTWCELEIEAQKKGRSTNYLASKILTDWVNKKIKSRLIKP
jgi:hypothetical protein